jgi:branched-chain amino acid aminotransferase
MSKQDFDFEKFKVYFRGEFVDFEDAKVSIANTAFLYGLGVFTGCRVNYNKEQEKSYIFRAKDHYERLRNSCKMFKFQNFKEEYPYEKFEEVLCELVKVNEFSQDGYFRVTEFVDERAIGPKFGYEDSLAVYLYPIGDYVSVDGLKVCVSSWDRIDDNAIPPRGKVNGAYVNTAFAKTEALENGFDEAIVLDRQGHAVEGSAENLFMVRNDKVITPPLSDNILEGITRKTVMAIAQDEGFEVVERSIDRTELYFADELFFSGTGAQVAPIVQVDSYEVGDGSMGPIAKNIQKIYWDAVRGKVDKYKDWLVEVK